MKSRTEPGPSHNLKSRTGPGPPKELILRTGPGPRKNRTGPWPKKFFNLGPVGTRTWLSLHSWYWRCSYLWFFRSLTLAWSFNVSDSFFKRSIVDVSSTMVPSNWNKIFCRGKLSGGNFKSWVEDWKNGKRGEVITSIKTRYIYSGSRSAS